jgi:ABC-type glycerol-3-phosphate transport system permease component
MNEPTNNALAFFIQLVPLTIVLIAFAVPVARILRRLGFSRAWAILSLIPIANIIAVWVLAYSKWPSDRDNAEVFR